MNRSLLPVATLLAATLAALPACSDGDEHGLDATGGGGTSGSGGSGGSAGTGGACVDTCPAPNGGVAWECRTRFLYGVNYAWDVFGGDFGGIPEWSQSGVAANDASHSANLAAMRSAGVSTIRWWLFPDFRSAAIEVDSSETVTGIGGTALADVQRALELAEQADVYLMLCLFSFDGFRPSQDVAGIWTPSIAPMVRDDTKRAALLDGIVRPVAAAVEASPYRRRVVAWDVINEPEWAITGSSPYGDPDYEPNGELDAVSHAEMERLIADTITVLRAESSALITVGAAAVKWQNAWTHVDLDFYQFHIYEWVNEWWPFSTPAGDYGLDKPMVMGEMPMTDNGLGDGIPYATVLASFWDTGYAGAMGWMFTGASQAELDNVAAFAAQHLCETHYSPVPAEQRYARPHGRRSSSGWFPSLRPCLRTRGKPVCHQGY